MLIKKCLIIIVIKEHKVFKVPIWDINMRKIQIILPKKRNSQTRGPSWETYHLIPVPKSQRFFWPPYQVDFALMTDAGTIITRVVGESGKKGDPNDGSYITKGLGQWYRNHSKLRPGSILEARRLEDFRYNLRVKKVK